jgi:hypothetical protein
MQRRHEFRQSSLDDSLTAVLQVQSILNWSEPWELPTTAE